MKVADVKLSWTRSPSADAARVEVHVTVNGQETKTEFGPEVQDLVVEVAAGGSVQFRVVTFDSEGNSATSETYSFTLGDLEAPQPASNLFHEVVGVRDAAGA